MGGRRQKVKQEVPPTPRLERWTGDSATEATGWRQNQQDRADKPPKSLAAQRKLQNSSEVII